MTTRGQIPSKVKKGAIPVQDRLKKLNETEHFAVLATIDNGRPYTSLVAYAVTPDLKKFVFTTPKDTRKYKNILNSGYVALLIDNRLKSDNNLMNTEAMTITGIAKPLRRGKIRDEYSRIFLEKHPDFEEFIKSATTAIIAVDITQCVHVSEFQTITVWDCC